MNNSVKEKSLGVVLLIISIIFSVAMLTLFIAMIVRVICANEDNLSLWTSVVNCIISGLSLVASSLTTFIAFKINSGILSNARLSNSGAIQIMNVFVDGKRGFKLKNYGGGPCQIDAISVVYDGKLCPEKTFLELIRNHCPSMNTKKLYYTDSISGRAISADESFYLFAYTGSNYLTINALNDVMSKIEICVSYNSYIANEKNGDTKEGFFGKDICKFSEKELNGHKKSLFLRYIKSGNPTGLTERENEILDTILRLNGKISQIQAGSNKIELTELNSLKEMGYLCKDNSEFYFAN